MYVSCYVLGDTKPGIARATDHQCFDWVKTYQYFGDQRITTYPAQVRHTLVWMFGEKQWCLKEKVLLGKWSAFAMLELQRIWFAGWALTKGQHRPKAGKKKKTCEAGLFFLVPASF